MVVVAADVILVVVVDVDVKKWFKKKTERM